MGCSSIRNYDRELTTVSKLLATGNVEQAVAVLESNNKKEDKDLLYFMEKGELLRIKGDLQASQAAWMAANLKVQLWEDAVKADPARYVNAMASYLVNDKIRRYEGFDYEKVMLTTQMALNYIAMNDWASARVAIRQTHEREALIARVNELLYLKQEEAVREQGVQPQFKDLNGYPVASIDTPSVVNLKNSYQSSFSHYLAGYIYEALGEKGLAAPGYRNAIELKPNTPILESALENLTSNADKTADQSDILIVLQSGLAPKRESLSLNYPIMTKDGIIQVAISVPVISDVGLGSKFNTVVINGHTYPLTEIASLDAMSKRALRDELPSIILRTSVRAASRAVAQQQLNKEVSPWAGLAMGIVGAILEQADVRTWRTLPESVQIARLNLSKGKKIIGLPNGEQLEVTISDNYQVIQLIQVGNKVYVP